MVTLLEHSRLRANKAITHKLSYRYLMLVSIFHCLFFRKRNTKVHSNNYRLADEQEINPCLLGRY